MSGYKDAQNETLKLLVPQALFFPSPLDVGCRPGPGLDFAVHASVCGKVPFSSQGLLLSPELVPLVAKPSFRSVACKISSIAETSPSSPPSSLPLSVVPVSAQK